MFIITSRVRGSSGGVTCLPARGVLHARVSSTRSLYGTRVYELLYRMFKYVSFLPVFV